MLTSEANKARSIRRAERILIIEDEALLREAIADSLQQESYEVLTAANGSAGLNLILPSQVQNSEALPDLLILDLILPDMNGFDLCRQIRQGGSNLPIL